MQFIMSFFIYLFIYLFIYNLKVEENKCLFYS